MMMKSGRGTRIGAYLMVIIQCAQLGWVGIPRVYAEATSTYPAWSIVQTRDTQPKATAESATPYTPQETTDTIPDSNTTHEPPVTIPKPEAEEAPLFAIPRESLLSGATVTEQVKAERGGKVALGAASITIPPGALEQDTAITITRLLATGDTGEVTNATAGGGGYRFLPAGQQFSKAATIRIPYEAELEGKPAALEEVTTYYYNTEVERWEALERIAIDREQRVLVSETTHFTDMINGTLSLPEGPEPLSFNINSIKGLEAADPSAGVVPLEGLEANYMGSAGFRFALALPAGRAGMTPSVAVGYSSEGSNGILGKGWSLEAGGEITYDTRRGLPAYEKAEAEKGTFMLDGVVLERKGTSRASPYEYRPLKESGFEKIQHYVGNGGDYWSVTDKRGTERIYGKRDGDGASWMGSEEGKKYRWLLESVTDSFGNRIRYEYENADKELYLKDIWYTEFEGEPGPYRVAFEYDDTRKDITVNGRGKFIAETKRRLTRIVMKYKGEVIRSYRVRYLDEEDAALSEKLFGITRLVKFGEESLEGAEAGYRWAYEFTYEEPPEDEQGRPALFGEAERWAFDGAIQEQHGESGGGSATMSGGIGIGSTPKSDARVNVSGHYGSTSGYMATERTLADIDGDGKPDSVWMEGGVLKAYLNTGKGFAIDEPPMEWRFIDGSGPGDINREAQKTISYGGSFFMGAGLPHVSPGVDTGETVQESWSDEEIGFSDINGDGLVDLAVKGETYYWRNTGSALEKTSYQLAGSGSGIPADVERTLSEEEIKKYDAAYYQQAPFRSWRAPVTGVVEVRQRVKPAAGKRLTEEGVRVYTYNGGGRVAQYKVDAARPEYDDTREARMTRGDALYFLSDAGSEIGGGETGSDIEWNIQMDYTRIRYFEGLDRKPRFVGNSEENPLAWAGEQCIVIPGILNGEVFAALQAAAKGKEYRENGHSPMWYDRLGEALPGQEEALFRYYRYDAGLGVCEINTALRDVLNEQDKQRQRDILFAQDEYRTQLQAKYGGISDEDWDAFLEDLRGSGRSWRHLESQVLNVLRTLDEETWEALVGVQLPGMESAYYPLYETETNTWYYGETGEPAAITEEGKTGWYVALGKRFYIDQYEGKELTIDTKTKEVRWGDEHVGRGVLEEIEDTMNITVHGAGYRQTYEFREVQRWKERLIGEEVEELTSVIRERAWLSEPFWKILTPDWYDALLGYATSGGQGAVVTDAYYINPEENYELRSVLDSDDTAKLEDCIQLFMADTFMSCYRAPEAESETPDDEYVLKADVSGIALSVLEQISADYYQYGWKQVARSIRYYEDGEYPVTDNTITLLVIREGTFVREEIVLGDAYRWNSGTDFSTEDFVADKTPRYKVTVPVCEAVIDEEGNYTGKTVETGETEQADQLMETVEVLSGGVRQWYYGVWFKGQAGSAFHNSEPFEEDKLFIDVDQYRNKSREDAEKEAGVNKEEATGEKKPPLYAPAVWHDEDDWTPLVDEETGRKITGSGIRAGPISMIQRRVGREIVTDCYAPWIMGDEIHTNRAGGDTYVNIPGIRKAPQVSSGSLTMGSLNKSYSEGEDTVITGGFGIGVLNVGANKGWNNSTSWQQQSVQDINGDGYADIVQSSSDALLVTPGVQNGRETAFGSMYSMGGGGDISRNESKSTSLGGTINGSGGINLVINSRGNTVSLGITSGGGLTSSDGTVTQERGLVDINGDGLPDVLDKEAVELNIGSEFRYIAGWGQGYISKGESGSTGGSVSLTNGPGEQPGEGRITGATGSADLSGSINGSSSYTSNYETLMDMNGDGLPDKVIKESNNPNIDVYFNLGSTFSTDCHTFKLSDWKEELTGTVGGDGSPPVEGFSQLPYFGSVQNKLPTPDHVSLAGVNALDYTYSHSWGLAGGMGVHIQISIYIPILFAPGFFINIPIAAGGSVNWSSFSSQVTMRTMDMDGDGLPDRVLRVKGDNSIYVRRNLLGRVGLLRTIKHPQGGRTEIDYEYMPGTPQMPQSKYVMSRVTKHDGETAEERIERGEEALGYKSAHEWTMTFEYEGGYYDRDAKEQYGFNTVISEVVHDRTQSITKTNQGEYHLKGLPYEQQANNIVEETWNTVTTTQYREAPYALVTQTRNAVTEHGETMESIVKYEYDDYGNVTRIEDTGNGVQDLRAEIEWGSPNDAKYYHAHPTMITVTSNGKLIRQRSGSYDSQTGALTSQTQYGGNNNNITTTIAYDRYGNLARIANGNRSWVGYTWDNTQHQYPVTIQRGGGTSIGPYTSKIEWNYALGVKTQETDENGEVIRYKYDRYGRLIEVQSPYDGATPAVRYEYHTEQGKRWYAVTENKVSFDPTDDNALTTVVAIDGLGRAIVTAKEGVKREGTEDIHGWNVAGTAVVDKKGRTVAQGQSEFVEYADPVHIAGYHYPAKQNGEYNNEYHLRYPTTTEYDTQDRPIKVTLPDDSLQQTAYRIGNQQSIVTAIDPLGNKNVQYTNVRGNVVKVERYGKDDSLLTSARYVYNAIGEMEQAIDHGNNVMSIEYDLLGRKTAMQSEDIGRKEYRYDKYGNLAEEMDDVLKGNAGRPITYKYDEMNRLVEIDYPYEASDSVVYEYGKSDAPGGRANRVTKVTDESGSIEYTYGKLGETTEEVRSIKRFNTGTGIHYETRRMGYTSNYLGQMEEIRFHDNEIVTYEYNAGGQVQKVSGAKPGSGGNFTYVEDIGYDEFGQRVYMNYGNGVTTTYQYDPQRRWLKHIETKKHSETYQDITYTLDKVGNVLAYENSAGLYTTKQTYEYDGLYQLTKVNGVSASDDHKTDLDHYRGTYEQSYSFDAIGNMTQKASTGNTNGRKNNALTYTLHYEYEGTPHRASRIGSMYYEYDGNGNLLTERYGSPGTTPGKERILQEEDGVYSTDYGFALTTRDYDGGNGSGTNERSYTWNERNQLRSSVDTQWTVQYRYGADGQRAIKYAVQGGTEHSETLYFNKMLQVGTIQKYGTGDIESKHIYVGETRIVTKQRTVGNNNYGQETENQYYYHGDHLGSAQVVTNYKGELYEHLEYTPYGELWIERTAEEGNLLPFRFTAKEYDRETGLYYYGARYLDPRTSRWISTDPAMGEYIPGAGKGADGLPGLGGIYNTTNLHTYHYAGNNPIKLIDPDGRIVAWVDFKKRESGWSHDALQRGAGFYDEYDTYLSPLVFDIHGTKFELNNVTLRLWKGDYGMRRDLLPESAASKVGGAGGEIGFYNPDGSSMTRRQLRNMGLESTKLEVFRKGSGEYVASREEKSRSFWTTSFSWDKQGKPEELYTINTLVFKDETTAAGFADKLRDARRAAEEYPTSGNESIEIEQEGKNVIIKWGMD